MLEILTRYQALPADVRAALSTPAVAAAIKNLELKYQRSLAVLVMRIALKDLAPEEFLSAFSTELNLSPATARELALDLRHTVFFGLSGYLFGEEPAVVAPVAASVQAAAPSALPTVEAIPAEARAADDFTQMDEVDQVISQSGIQFASSEMLVRLKKILGTYNLGIRDRLLTKDALTKPAESGGLAMTAAEAERLLVLLDGEASVTPEIRSEAADKPKWLRPAGTPLVRDIEYDFTALTAKTFQEPELPAAEEPELLERPELIAVEAPPALPTDAVAEEQSASTVKTAPVLGHSLMQSLASLPSVEEQPMPAPVASQPAAPLKPEPGEVVAANWRKAQSGKVIMDDIKAAPRVYSPIDELRFMTIKNFRQLSADPNRGVELIRDKIQSLAEDNYSNLSAAISAWKQSPVNRMYVELCQQALDAGQPLLKALAQRLKQEPDFLNENEFEAIIKLNRALTPHK